MDRKGLSQVISALLLIMIVVSVAVLVISWSKGITGKAVTYDGINVAVVCRDISFNADYTGGKLYMINTGNIPIYDLNIKILKTGSHEIKKLSALTTGWPSSGLGMGKAFSGEVSLDADVNSIKLIPILLGDTGTQKQEYVCDEGYGFEIEIV